MEIEKNNEIEVMDFGDIFTPKNDGFSGLFGPIDLEPAAQSQEDASDLRLFKCFERAKYKFNGRMLSNIEQIKEIYEQMEDTDIYHIISDAFDSPNFIKAFIGRIEEIYIATWSIHPSGFHVIAEIGEHPNTKAGMVMIYKSNSMFWMFRSGAASRHRGKIDIKLTNSHAKFYALKLTDSSCVTFVGSFNLSGNPHFENVMVSKSPEWFEFYKNCVLQMEGTIIE